MSKPDGFYVARCAQCGDLAISISDHPDWKKDTAKELAKGVRAGWTFEHLTYAQVQAMPFRMCACKNGPLQSKEVTKSTPSQLHLLEDV